MGTTPVCAGVEAGGVVETGGLGVTGADAVVPVDGVKLRVMPSC